MSDSSGHDESSNMAPSPSQALAASHPDGIAPILIHLDDLHVAVSQGCIHVRRAADDAAARRWTCARSAHCYTRAHDAGNATRDGASLYELSVLGDAIGSRDVVIVAEHDPCSAEIDVTAAALDRHISRKHTLSRIKML